MEERKSGEFVGAFPSYGYIKNPEDNHKLIIDKESAEIVRKIFEWKVNEGLGNLSICHRLNDMGVLNPTGYKKKKLSQNYNNSRIMQEDYSWCPSTVRNILKNDIYIGNVTQGKRRVKSYKVHKIEQVPEDEWITVENMHEPIIDKDILMINKITTILSFISMIFFNPVKSVNKLFIGILNNLHIEKLIILDIIPSITFSSRNMFLI